MIRALAFLFSIVIFCFSGCNPNQKPSKIITEAEFRVDKNLLNPLPASDSVLNLNIGIPRDWVLMDEELKSGMRSSLLIGDYKDSDLRFGYIYPADSSIMMLIDIGSIDTTVFTSLKKNYAEILNTNNTWIDVQLQEFVYKSFRIEQYVLQNTQLLNFKLIFYDMEDSETASPKFELLYFINIKGIASNMGSVESSIGSIEYITK